MGICNEKDRRKKFDDSDELTDSDLGICKIDRRDTPDSYASQSAEAEENADDLNYDMTKEFKQHAAYESACNLSDRFNGHSKSWIDSTGNLSLTDNGNRIGRRVSESGCDATQELRNLPGFSAKSNTNCL